MFEAEPSTRALFNRVNVDDMHSGEFHAHSLRVVNALDNLINKLHNADTLTEMLAHLADQHHIREGVRHHYFHVSHVMVCESL